MKERFLTILYHCDQCSFVEKRSKKQQIHCIDINKH